MNCKTTHLKLKGAGFVVALALLAPAVAHATSTGDERPAGAARGPAPHFVGAGGRALEPQAVTAAGQRGLSWHAAAIGAGIMLGILLLGLWGDVAVGAAIAGAAAVLGAGATLATRAGSAAGAAVSRVLRHRRSEPPLDCLLPTSSRSAQPNSTPPYA